MWVRLRLKRGQTREIAKGKQIETLQADCLNKHSHLLQENLKHRKAGSLPGHSIRNLCPNLLLFMSFSFMGDVAADLFPFGFAGVSSNRLAPVFVHTVTMETGVLSVVTLIRSFLE